MQTVIILNIIAVFIAFLARFKHFERMLEFAFVFIFFFTALRFDFGTDYHSYLDYFDQINQYTNINLINFNLFPVEPGWVILNFIFKPVGFFGFIFILSAFLCYTYYSLIKKYVNPKFYWLAVLIYVFTFDIMLLQFSAMRQALAVALFITSIKYLDEKKNPVKYVLLNLFAGLFHTSAFILIPIVVFSLEKFKKSNISGLLIFTLFFMLLFWGVHILSQLKEFSSFIFGQRYLSRFDINPNSSTTLTGIIFWSSIMLSVLYYSRYQPQNMKYLFFLCSINYLVYVLYPLVFLSSRIGYYFVPFTIIVYPSIIQNEKNKLLKYGILSLYLTLIFYNFNKSFQLDWVIEGYSTYQTIF
jgi:transmembrane protein EpsG